MRKLSLLFLAAWLGLASNAAFAQEQPTDEAPAPTGPVLQASDNAPLTCDAGSPRMRYVEVRGTGFDAFATQHLVGNLVDGNGVSQLQWGSIWVSPQGGLTLEVNLCADAFRGRPALPAGSYTVWVGQGSGAGIAATSIDVSPPAEPAAESDVPAPDAAVVPALPSPTAIPAPTAMPYVLPNIAPAPTPMPFNLAVVAPTAVPPGPKSGPGSRQQPYPLGAPGMLVDGWQLLVTGVTPDAWTGIHNDFPLTAAPASDLRDYLVRVQATYQGQGSGDFSGARLALVSSSQNTYDQSHNNCGTVSDAIQANVLTAGGVVRGNVCFTVRATDIGSLVLIDNQPSDTDKVYFSLS